MLVSKQHRKVVLNLRNPDRITTVIPTAKTFEYKGATLVAVPHKDDEVRVLRNLGFDAPAPITHYYTWPGKHEKPFAHQIETASFLTMNPRAFCLNGMGSGKTVSVLWSFDYLRKAKCVKRMLVIAPLSTLERTWGDEIFSSFNDMTFAVLHGSKDKRLKLLNNDFDVYIINHDGLKTKEVVQAIIARTDIDLIVVDEIASFRNAQTDRWKALFSLTKTRNFVWGLTGTPTPNAPTDAWAQVRLISPANVPPYFNAFRDSVMRQQGPYTWLPRDTASDTVSRVMQPAIRFSREDCIDLPPTTYVTREVAMTPEQNVMYRDMLNKLKAEQGENQIMAVNEAVKTSKLLQIACGAAYDSDGSTVFIPSKPRMDALMEIIEEAGSKVIVFVPFTGALMAVAEFLGKSYSVATIHGGTSKGERDVTFHDFQKAKNPHVLVANPAAMSHGLTLTAASVIVWFAPTMSNEIYEQANARIVRPGQKLNTLIAHLEGSSVERAAYERLQKRGKMQGLLLDLLKEKQNA